MPQQSPDDGFHDHAPAARCMTDQAHVTSGIVVFSSAQKPLYMNQAAQQLLSQLHRPEMGLAVIPPSVHTLLSEILPLVIAGGDRSWKQFETRRFPTARDRSLLVRTFGIPDRRDSQRSLIVLTIQETDAS